MLSKQSSGSSSFFFWLFLGNEKQLSKRGLRIEKGNKEKERKKGAGGLAVS